MVLGIPLLCAALGPQYASLGAVAGISSFIFQLPLMLMFFEGSSGRQETKKEQSGMSMGEKNTSDGSRSEGSGMNIEAQQKEDEACEKDSWLSFSLSRERVKYIAIKIARNPILWAIFIGIIISVSSLGPKYLNPGPPPNPDYAVGSGFIFLTLKTFASCTQPIALFAVGVFLVNKNPIACGIVNSIIYMIIKLILVPALMIGCAKAVGLDGAEGRAAVLLASLPVSPTAYTVSNKYDVGQDISESNIFFGNLLVLPTTIGWVSFMDAVDLFPADAPSNSASAC